MSRRKPGLTVDTSADTVSAAPIDQHSATPTSPLDEDIDFSLVYALHTFVATMEGQVAVVRNEPLILLDDSNSYWWLVKPLNSNSIGYIPAEIVETPYERLARVNRQKNIELALFRETDIPGAESKSSVRLAQPDLPPQMKSVQFNSGPFDFFEYEVSDSEWSEESDGFCMDEEDEETRAAKKRSSVGAGLALSNKAFDDESDDEHFESSSEEGETDESLPSPTESIDSQELGASEETLSESTAKPTKSENREQSPKKKSEPLEPITVLRIFPGKCNIKKEVARFKTVVLTKTMTVEELIRQAMLKYRLFGPLSTNPDMNNEMTEEMIRDWYLTLQVNGSAEHILNPSENVIQILSTLQAPSPTSPSVQFGTTLYSPTVPSGKLPSKHHISRPILQVISPNDTNSVKLLLNQHSVIQKLLAESNNRLIKVVLYGEELVGTSASSKSHQTVVPIKPVPVRMVKTLKINVNLPASEVIALALEKFKKVEGKRSLGTVQEYELFIANDKLGDHGHDVMSLRGIERELRSLGSPLSPEKPLPNIQEKTKMMTFLLHDKRMRSLSREPENGNHKQQPKDVRTRTTIILPTTSNPSSSSSTNLSTSDSNASKTIQSSKPVNLTLPPPPASSPPVARSNSNSTPESSSSKPQSESTLRPKKKEHELVIPPARTSSIIQKSPSLPLLQSASRMPSSSQVQKPQLQRSYSSDSARSIDSTTGAPRIDIIGIEEVKTFDLDDLMGLVNSKKAEGTGDSLNTVPLNQAIQTEALNQPMAPSAEPEQIAHVNDTSVLGNSETLASPTTDISLTETDISTVDERVEEPNGVTESAESKEDALQTPEQHDHKFTKIDSAVNVAVATGSAGV